MRILVVGAGALGGYFGGRLIQAGRDVTFLVRAGRAEELKRSGLVIKSQHGDATLRDVPTVVANDLRAPYDLVLLSCKAYNLDDAIQSFAPAVGPQTMILPVLNGMRHIDVLTAKFGAANVLGGIGLISATLNRNREIEHLNDSHAITYGELAGGISARVQEIGRTFEGAGFDSKAADPIVQQMWDKWIFLATLAASTCVSRASIGDILRTPDGKRLIEGLFDECRAVAQHNGFPMSDGAQTRARAMLFNEASQLSASMLRDIENRSKIEADHILGDMIERGAQARQPDAQQAGLPLSLLRVAYTHMKAYEVREGLQAA
ncbi:2-dehydropantoate 2-reductase [Paraburkholderia rhizosphaerae]|uniref:2-dehydropantoate 2-reductase n=1 Tax=Paraburkholderia rhizosphaerae TaxID=480658 RepID=A0A4V3HFC4_9BURK|nr:2-dehydropantoate 2-reductase [Paraburkholderia rhizosphaerae]TDY52365.1 ketopantoate reductase [Paraburkholderia rhizosphaerae]